MPKQPPTPRTAARAARNRRNYGDGHFDTPVQEARQTFIRIADTPIWKEGEEPRTPVKGPSRKELAEADIERRGREAEEYFANNPDITLDDIWEADERIMRPYFEALEADERAHRELDRKRDAMEALDVEETAARLEARYGRLEKSKGTRKYGMPPTSARSKEQIAAKAEEGLTPAGEDELERNKHKGLRKTSRQRNGSEPEVKVAKKFRPGKAFSYQSRVTKKPSGRRASKK